jgi:hypothetical protein
MAKQAREPDPDRLVRESAGSYRTQDGRFKVHSAGGAGRWYLTDTARHDGLGLEQVIGPFETLDEVRPAIVTQRDAPEDAPPQLPGQDADQAVEQHPKSTRAKAARKPATPEPEPHPEPMARARPAANARLARWRRRGDQRDEVAATLRRISAAWTSAQPEQADEFLDLDAVFVQPGFDARLEGRDAVIASYREFLEASLVHVYEEHDLQVDVVGATAVATYRFRIDWESEGVRHDDHGHDLFVFARVDDGWRAVWRTLIVDKAAAAR